MKTICLIILLSISFFACKNNNANNKKTELLYFDVNDFSTIGQVRLSELGFEDIKYIILETKDSSIVTGSNDLILGNQIILGKEFIITKHYQQIMKFSYDGKFLGLVGKIGRGPNEFTVAYDVKIEKTSQNIYLLALAGSQMRFIVYTKDGSLIKSIDLPFYAFEFEFVEGNILCYSENHMSDVNYSYHLMDTMGRIIKRYKNIYEFTNHDAFGFTHENLFYTHSDRLFKKEVYSDTVYRFSNMCFIPHLVLDVGLKRITTRIRSEFDALYIMENYIQPITLMEFGEYIYYSFLYRYELFIKPQIYSFIGSKNTNFVAIIDTEEGFINDLDGGPNIIPVAVLEDYTVIGWVDALQLKNHVKSGTFINSRPLHPEKKKELEKLANSLKETDNPVLILVRLKK